MQYDVIVIGSGVGGLTASSMLSVLGYKVLVLEKHFVAGGYATNFKRKGYNFDVSLHGIGGLSEGGNLHRILSTCEVLDKIEAIKVKTSFSAYYKGKLVELPNDYEEYKNFYINRFSENKDDIEKLFKDINRFSNGFKKFILEKDKGIFNKLHRDVLLFIKWSSKTTDEVMRDYTLNEEFIKMFTTMWTYYGLPPQELSALYFFIPWISYHIYGKYYIKGGAQELSNAFIKSIEEHGGEVRLKAEVSEILYEDNLIKGVKLKDGTDILSKYVISNASPIVTEKLLGDNILSDEEHNKISESTIGCTLTQLYIGLDCEPSEINIPDDEVFFVEGRSHREDYQMALSNQYEKSGFLLTNYSSMDESFNDKNKGVLTMTYIDNYDYWKDDKEEYKKQKIEITKKMVERLCKYYPKIREHIVVLELGTPKTMERYTGNPKGAVYGYTQTVKQAGKFRFKNQTSIENLSFVGAWTSPGGGYEGSISGGITEAIRISKILKVNK